MKEFRSGNRMRSYDLCSFVRAHELLGLNIVQIKLDSSEIKGDGAVDVSRIQSEENTR